MFMTDEWTLMFENTFLNARQGSQETEIVYADVLCYAEKHNPHKIEGFGGHTEATSAGSH